MPKKSQKVPILEWFELEAICLWKAKGYQLLQIAGVMGVGRHSVCTQIYRGVKAQGQIAKLNSWRQHAAGEARLVARRLKPNETISLEAKEAAEMFLRAGPEPDCPHERVQELGVLDAALSLKDADGIREPSTKEL